MLPKLSSPLHGGLCWLLGCRGGIYLLEQQPLCSRPQAQRAHPQRRRSQVVLSTCRSCSSIRICDAWGEGWEMNGPVANRILLEKMNEKGGTSWWHLFLSNAFKIQSVSFIFSPVNPMLCKHLSGQKALVRVPEGSALLSEVLASEWIYETTLAWLLWWHAEDTWGRGSRWELLIEGEDANHQPHGFWQLYSRRPSLVIGTCPTGNGNKPLSPECYASVWTFFTWQRGGRLLPRVFPSHPFLFVYHLLLFPSAPPLYNTRRHTHSHAHLYMHSHVHSSLHTSLNSHFPLRTVLGGVLLGSAKQWFEGQGKRKKR